MGVWGGNIQPRGGMKKNVMDIRKIPALSALSALTRTQRGSASPHICHHIRPNICPFFPLK